MGLCTNSLSNELLSGKRDFGTKSGFSKREISREFELHAVRRTFESCARALIVDDEEIAVWAIDVAEAHIDE